MMAVNTFVLRFRFHILRQWQMRPIAFAVLGVPALALTCAIAVYGQAWEEAETAKRELQTIGGKIQTSRIDQTVAKLQPALSPFRSKHLVEALGHAARETKLPLDEIQFSLEDNGNQPYLRYRATLTVSSGYSAIRRFLDQLQVEAAGISIDTISCTRADIGTAGVTCDLAVSAFYRRSERG